MTDVNQGYSLGGFGARLKAAREALNLSQKDAAVRLHLNANILQILESEDFQKAPPITFVRGYLRSYARLLNFSEQDINDVLTSSGLETHTSSLVPPTLRIETVPAGDRYVQWISTAVVLGLFVFVGIWWGLHSTPSNNNRLGRTPTPLPPKPAQVVAPLPAPTPVPAQPVSPPAATPLVTAPPVPAPVVSNQPEPAAPATPITSAPPAMTPIPGTDPLDTITPPSTTPVIKNDTDQPKKRHHKQSGDVSGVTMALPEPGL